VFEDILTKSLPLPAKHKLLPFMPDRFGKIWVKAPNQKRKSYEIDIRRNQRQKAEHIDEKTAPLV